MIISVLVLIISIIPSVLIIKWLMNRRNDDPAYRECCKEALKKGLISVLPIIGVSALFAFLKNVLQRTVLTGLHPLVFDAIETFIVLALAEEFVKYFLLIRLLDKKICAYSWADVTAFMVIIGTAFGLIEDIPYAVGASPMVMIVRGVTMGHVGYGFLMGWLYGKGLYTGNKAFRTYALLIPALLHGIYDFSLEPDLLKVNDNLAFIGISMALIDIVLLVLMIRFFIRSKKIERYNTCLFQLSNGL